MLVRGGAQQWSVPEAECSTGLHEVLHKKSGKTASYGSLVAAAAKLPVPKKEELKLKPRSEWRYMGKGVSSYDLKDMITGKATYRIDSHMQAMLYPNGDHPPVVGATLKP